MEKLCSDKRGNPIYVGSTVCYEDSEGVYVLQNVRAFNAHPPRIEGTFRSPQGEVRDLVVDPSYTEVLPPMTEAWK